MDNDVIHFNGDFIKIGILSNNPILIKTTMKEMHTIIDKAGRIVIPASFRQALGIKPGEEVIVQLCEGEVRIFTIAQAIARAQQLVAHYNPNHRLLSEELIRMRRQEASDEEKG